VVLLLFKTGPSAESSSDGTIATRLFFSRGAGKGEVLTVPKGIAAIGVGEVGVWVLCEGRGSCAGCGEASFGVSCGETGVGVA